ncbi:MAG: class I SAM-dependent methyltransferase [Zoogloeaceae bacterium]|jgi:tellurite methyltransferase|nr:class I SAM-dependent methyltransferase [Zoogloeaceae bacterium]
MTDPIRFFDNQFRCQVAAGDFALNPFEQAALPYLKGRVLDLGCGLGNLALEAGRRGCEVLAVDVSPAAVERINRDAASGKLNVRAVAGDLGSYAISGSYDTVVAIGLLPFFPRDKALPLLTAIQSHVGAEGCAIVNVLIEGTTWLEMFEAGRYTLFGRDEIERRFDGWRVCFSRHDEFDAPGGARKMFSTVIACRHKTAVTLQ